MPNNLLPGVTVTEIPPAVVFDSRSALRQARRRRILHDLLDLTLLGGVDYLFVHWPSTHIPLMGREDSLVLLAFANALLVGCVWLARVWPRWSARRIASTWCLAERARFFAADRREQLHQQR